MLPGKINIVDFIIFYFFFWYCFPVNVYFLCKYDVTKCAENYEINSNDIQ